MAVVTKSQEHKVKEGIGWVTLVFMMVIFPILFFACVFFPIYVGWTSRW